MKKNKILIGWGSRDVTPKGKVSLCGQFHVRITDEIHDPLTTTALALESADGSEQAIIVSLDAVCISDILNTSCRKILKKELSDFTPDKLLISAISDSKCKCDTCYSFFFLLMRIKISAGDALATPLIG